MRLYAREENHVALFAAAEDFRVGFTPVRGLKMGSADILRSTCVGLVNVQFAKRKTLSSQRQKWANQVR
jgi:hypothetical protein